VAGNSGKNHKTADSSLKINFFQMQFYLYPELGLKKYAPDQEILNFGNFLKI
jgi:hypothetical protein